MHIKQKGSLEKILTFEKKITRYNSTGYVLFYW